MDEYQPGSREDFDRLYRTTYRNIVATLYGVLADRTLAEDGAQETFIRAWVAWKRWKPTAPAEAWLHRIALNVAHDMRRHGRLRTVGEYLRRFGRVSTTTEFPDDAHLDLLHALRQLPEKQAAAIVLRHLHGYSNREIAYVLHVPERTVASRIAAARTRLQAEMGTLQGSDVFTSDGPETGTMNGDG